MNDRYVPSIKGATVLITGGTGSFGQSVLSNLLEYGPREVIIFSRDEKKQFDMRNLNTDHRLRFVIGDVRDRDSLNSLLETVSVTYIFHAAALKQVPACEFFPLEAIKTNIIGASNVMEAAIHYSVGKVVILSTDKAAYPINAMGMTKALMEKVMVANARKLAKKSGKKTILCGVRYGNVLYSRGSVIPYFISLMKQGKQLPVTDKRMTRFLLPLPVAVDLVLHAMAVGKNGHMYIRKAPACTIETLAQALCELFSYKKGYTEVGIRTGEKLHETLVTREEMFRAEDQGNYFQIPPESQGLDYDQYFVRGIDSSRNVQPYTSEHTTLLDKRSVTELLSSLPHIQKELHKRS